MVDYFSLHTDTSSKYFNYKSRFSGKVEVNLVRKMKKDQSSE